MLTFIHTGREGHSMQPWAEKFYKSDNWKKTRYAYLVSQNFICERCGGRATMVHHRKYLTDQRIKDPELTVGFGNLEALCEACHDAEHKADSPLREGFFFDKDGMLQFVGAEDEDGSAEAPRVAKK